MSLSSKKPQRWWARWGWRITSQKWLLVLFAVVLSGAFGADKPADAPAGAAEGGASPTSQPADVAAPPGEITQELKDAIKSLAKADDAGRKKVYDLVMAKGDARLVPVLRAYQEQRLQNRNGRLVIYGEQVDVPGRGKGRPLLDAFTQEQVKEDDGSPAYSWDDKINLGAEGMMRIPPRARNEAMVVVPDLIRSLSLLDPDPVKRVESILDVGTKAHRAIYTSEWSSNLAYGLGHQAVKLDALLKDNPTPEQAETIRAAKAAVEKLRQGQSEQMAAKKRVELKTSEALAALEKVQKAYDADAQKKQELADLTRPVKDYEAELDRQRKSLDDTKKFKPILTSHLEKEKADKFKFYLKESLARIDLAIGNKDDKIAAAKVLGDDGTTRARNTLNRALENAVIDNEPGVEPALREAIAKVDSYQNKIRFVEHTFYGLSSSSILILLALGLSIIFGLMGVINMAHGEFMMIGAFTTLVVSEFFKANLPAYFDYYPIAAVPAAFIVAAVVGLLCEVLVVRHLYGKPLETLLATWGIGLILVWAVRSMFGDNVSVSPPSWMKGSWEVMPDLNLNLNRVFIIVYCALCIAIVWFLVNRTKLGLLLRATTQNREMAAALGVSTRRVDMLTFALGAGLAGLAGVVVPMFDKINPNMGIDYVVESFMVVVVGGVGKLAGAIWAGLALGFLRKYLEPLLQYVPAFDSSASVIGRVIVLGLIVAFLQWRPQGLFPPKGRLADA